MFRHAFHTLWTMSSSPVLESAIQRGFALGWESRFSRCHKSLVHFQPKHSIYSYQWVSSLVAQHGHRQGLFGVVFWF